MCKRFTGRLSRRREGEPTELDAGLVPMEEEREGKRMHRVSLRPPSTLSSLCLQDFGICPGSLCCLLRFGDTFSPRLLNFSSKCFFSLAQTFHVADKVRPAESHQRIQLGLSSQAGTLTEGVEILSVSENGVPCCSSFQFLRLQPFPLLPLPSPLWINPVFFFCT